MACSNTEGQSESSFSDLAKEPATILRVKRRIDEDPAQALLLKFKRQKKSEEVDAEPVKYRFAGTLTPGECQFELNEEERSKAFRNVLAKVLEEPEPPSASSSSTKTSVKQTEAINPQERARANFRNSTSEHRFRLVASKRDLKENDSASNSLEDEQQELFNLFDLVDESEPKKSKENKDPRELGAITCNGVPLIKDTVGVDNELLTLNYTNPDDDFVYDLYYSQEGFGSLKEEAMMDPSNIFMIRGDVEWSRQTFGGESGESGEDDDGDGEEDSNDEDNWRNDYPDVDPDDEPVGSTSYYNSAVDELGSYIGGMDLNDSSSDDGDYYAAYKKRVSKELDLGYSNEVVSVSEDDSE